MGKSTISIAIFNSYVSLPEGKLTRLYGKNMLDLCRSIDTQVAEEADL